MSEKIDLTTPKLIPPRVWTCGQCGRQDVWGPGWVWFGDLGGDLLREDPVRFVACSKECARQSPWGFPTLIGE
jgi:hypothetical protein